MLVELFIPEGYRSYNPMVPKYLHNRPPLFIKHCLKSKFNADEYQERGVVCQDDQRGVFHVRSSTEYDKHHVVLFDVPSCACEAWDRSHYPCKHFYAVFKFYEEWGFEKLPASYQNSPFPTLDPEMNRSNHDKVIYRYIFV